MDLKTGNLLWPALSNQARDFSPLSLDLRCEVAIIGAGISGAMAALALAEAGVDVVVVDRRQPAEGSTSASTAMVLYEIDLPLIELSKKVGEEQARQCYRACRRALADLSELVDRHQIDCGLINRGSLYLAKNDCDLNWFADEIAARRSCDIDVELIDSQALLDRFHLYRPGAIHSQAAMEVDPYRLTLGLIDRAVKLGVRVFGGTDVDLKSGSATRHLLQTSGGASIACNHLVIATGYETPEQFASIRKLCSLESTYALASQRVDNPWPEAKLIWETGEPYLYARLCDSRVILGGEDEAITEAQKRDALIDKKVVKLLNKFAALYPSQTLSPEFVWAGTFATTEDGLPFIGSLDQYPGCHFALGYGGNGITFSLLASQIIRDAVIGRTNPDAKLFRFGR